MATEKRLIPLQKRIIYGGDVFNSLMSEKKWSATEASDFVKAFRTVDAVEVVHGRWEKYIDDDDDKCCRCTACGWRICYEDCSLEDLGYNYCPNCGADMRGDGDG